MKKKSFWDSVSLKRLPGTEENIRKHFVEGFTSTKCFLNVMFDVNQLHELASEDCDKCDGSGYVVSVLFGPLYGDGKTSGKGQTFMCECASSRFKEKNKCV